MRVVAILVAHSAGEHFATTLRAVAAQTRPADEVIVVDNGSAGANPVDARAAHPFQVVATGGRVPFGEAIACATRVTNLEALPADVLWLLGQDSVPTPTALENLLGSLEVSRSRGIVGPKQFDADEFELGKPGTIVEFGISMSPGGATVNLVDDELDQGQYDTMSDVLAVGANGMLVRDSVWRDLGGFDPGLPDVDNALDFCIRARLAGQLVAVVPAAGVLTSGDGVTAPPRVTHDRERRRDARVRRRAELYRRIAYARGIAPALIWLTLLPWALVRMIGQMLAKRPGLVMGELFAAVSVAFSFADLSRSRSNLRRQRTAPWSSLQRVLLTGAEVRRRRSLYREQLRLLREGEKRPMYFFSGGGAWTVAVLTAASFAMLLPLIGATSLGGGGIVPVGHGLGEMWSLIGFGWRAGTPGLIGPADPFTIVIALLGTLTWWQPSFALVLVWFLAIPLAGCGAWMFVARLTERPVIRAFAGLAYGLAPTLLISLSEGRPGAVLAHIMLPWLCFAGLRAARSWSALAATALLFAGVIACAPALAPALVIIWLGAIALNGRPTARLVTIPVLGAVLFAPLMVAQFAHANPFALLSDPGIVLASSVVPAWQIALGFPSSGLGGWLDVSNSTPLGLNVAAGVVVLVLVGILVALGILGLFSSQRVRTQRALLVTALGLVTAVSASNIRFEFDGSIPIATWSGSGMSLAWLALVVAATSGIAVVRRFSFYPAAAGMLAVIVLAIPLSASFYVGRSAVHASDDRVFPAYVSAQSATDSRIGTVVLTASTDGGINASLQRGVGPTLASASTLVSTNTVATESLTAFADLVGNLVSTSGSDSNESLRALGVGFVLLTAPQSTLGGDVTAEAHDADSRAISALRDNPALEEVGVTDVGLLWRIPNLDTAVVDALYPTSATEPWRTIVGILQFSALLLTLLLAIPTGTLLPAGSRREITERTEMTEAEFEPVDALGGDDESNI